MISISGRMYPQHMLDCGYWRQTYFFGFGPDLRSREMYSRTAFSVVTQLCPILIPHKPLF